MVRPVFTEPSFLMYVKRETDVHEKNWLVGHRLFTTQPADTVSLLPSETVDSSQQHPSEKTDGGQIGSVDMGLPGGRSCPYPNAKVMARFGGFSTT